MPEIEKNTEVLTVFMSNLFLEDALFRSIRPAQTFVAVDRAIHAHPAGHDLPADNFPHLRIRQKSREQSCVSSKHNISGRRGQVFVTRKKGRNCKTEDMSWSGHVWVLPGYMP